MRETANIESTKSKKIAIVDGNAALREQIFNLFNSSDCVVQQYDSANQLFSHSDLNNVDCLILSIEHTHLATKKVIESIRKVNSQLSIIAVGNQEDVPHAVVSLRAGADDYIYRPINNGKLRSIVRSLLSKSVRK